MKMNSAIYEQMLVHKANRKKQFAVLLDPDICDTGKLEQLIEIAVQASVDYFFIGGSLMVNPNLDYLINTIKAKSSIPTILFPGSSLQLSYKADGLLFLSLISGRNSDLLIGKHVETAAFLKISPLEIISTGYMLIDGGAATSVSYMSNTNPIPRDKDQIAMATAIAGEMLGLKTIFMDAGSGAIKSVSDSMIELVSQATDIPLIVGGGISTPESAFEKAKAGADIVVIGNAIEKDFSLITSAANAIHSLNKSIVH